MLKQRAAALLMIATLFLPTVLYGQNAGGLKAEFLSAKVDVHRRPSAIFKITDAQGNPLDLKDIDGESLKFTIAAIKVEKNGATQYHNYILSDIAGKDFVFKGETRQPALARTLQPSVEQGGTLAKLNNPRLEAEGFKGCRLEIDYHQ